MEACAVWAKAMVYDRTFRILIKDINRKMQKEEIYKLAAYRMSLHTSGVMLNYLCDAPSSIRSEVR